MLLSWPATADLTLRMSFRGVYKFQRTFAGNLQKYSGDNIADAIHGRAERRDESRQLPMASKRSVEFKV